MGNTRTEINKRWQSENKDYANYLKARSTARSFIKNKATKEDLEEMKILISARENMLDNKD